MLQDIAIRVLKLAQMALEPEELHPLAFTMGLVKRLLADKTGWNYCLCREGIKAQMTELQFFTVRVVRQ